MHPPPIPVPGNTPSTHRAPFADPLWYSAYTPASTSLEMTTGHPKLLCSEVRMRTEAHPRFGASRITPRSRSRSPGIPIPIPLSSFLEHPASSITRRIVSAIRFTPALAPRCAFVFLRTEATFLNLPSKTVAIILVPPRSKPIQQSPAIDPPSCPPKPEKSELRKLRSARRTAFLLQQNLLILIHVR